MHGLMSDMNGQKSIFLNNHCKKKDISYLSFDFRGHGKSSGNFEDFGIGDWFNDQQKITAEKIIEKENVKLSGKVVTKISLVKNYCPAEEYHQRYLEKR